MDAPDRPRDGPATVDRPAGAGADATPTLSERAASLVRRGAPTAAAIALLVAIGSRRYAGMANADALLPALMSTQQWTLFYWGQDRLGNLVPLLAMPIRDPVWNFEFQSLVIASAFFGLGAVFVSYHAWARRDRARPMEHAAATLLTGLLVMVPFHTVAGYRFAIEQLYFVSVLCWVGAVWAWHRHQRFVVGAALLQVATLVNPSLLLASPLVWLLDDRPEGRLRRSAGFIGASAAAFVVADVAARVFATGEDADRPYDEFRLDMLDTGIRSVAGNIAGSVRDHLATVVVIAAVVIVALSVRRLAPRAVAVYVALPVFSGIWFIAFSINGWVIQNQYEFRYFYPLYVTFMLFVAGAVTELVVATRRWRPSLERPQGHARALAAFELLSVVAAVAVAVLSVHRTDVAALRTAADPVATAREFDTRLVAGSYWTTWPTVVAGRSEGLGLLGVTYRSDPIVDEIRAELDRAADRTGWTTVVCSGVDTTDCIALVNERSARRWDVDEVVQDRPLVIRIVPAP